MKTIIALTSVVVLNCYGFVAYEPTSMNTSSNALEANIPADSQTQVHFLIDQEVFESHYFYKMFFIWKENLDLVKSVLDAYKSNPESSERLSQFLTNIMVNGPSVSERRTPGVWQFLEFLNQYNN